MESENTTPETQVIPTNIEAPAKSKSNNGCMFIILFLIVVGFIYYIKSDSEGGSTNNACLMSEDFIKSDLAFPNEADFSFLDCHSTVNSDGTFTVLRKISAKNAFGMEKDYIYKVEMRFNGGVDVDINNWELIEMRSEEVQ